MAPLDEGMLENMPAPQESDERMYQRIQSELVRNVGSKIKSMGKRGELMYNVFKKWMQQALDKGIDLNVDEHLVGPIMKEYRQKGDSVSRSTIYNAVRAVKEMIEDFMSRVRETGVEASTRERLHLSSMDVLVYEEFGKRLASWVLGK